ncbi:hypothetical protein [Pararhodospirillum photometricum]|nr:hypothetical protein [Pararhodospirillum photometricum]
MALCSKQCPTCIQRVTVRIEHEEKGEALSHVTAFRETASVLDLYHQMAQDLGEADGVAVILSVSGVEIAVSCPRARSPIEMEAVFF